MLDDGFVDELRAITMALFIYMGDVVTLKQNKYLQTVDHS